METKEWELKKDTTFEKHRLMMDRILMTIATVILLMIATWCKEVPTVMFTPANYNAGRLLCIFATRPIPSSAIECALRRAV